MHLVCYRGRRQGLSIIVIVNVLHQMYNVLLCLVVIIHQAVVFTDAYYMAAASSGLPTIPIGWS